MSTNNAPRSTAPRRDDATAPKATARRKPVKATVSSNSRPADAPQAPTTWGQRMRGFIPTAAAPLLITALAVVAICFAVILISGWRLAYLPAAIGQTWLTVNGAPLSIDGVEVANVPLLPTIGIVALIAARIRAAARRKVSVRDIGAILAVLALTSLTLSVIALFMVTDAANVFAIDPPNPAAALLAPLVAHLAGFAIGVGPKVWRALARHGGVPEEAAVAAAAAFRFVVALLACGLAVYVVLLGANVAGIRASLDAYPNLGTGGRIALWLICLGYLPNAAVATLAVLLGGSFDYAAASVSLFDATAVPAPPLPLFAAVPSAVPAWAPALMLIPAAVVVRFVLKEQGLLIDALSTATWAALFGAFVGVYAAGAVGAYGVVGANPWTLALTLFVWASVAGLAGWLLARVRGD
ncbi:DUF6350 family protein [Corynebacterium sp. Q4381]|uniref:cell division protein PerM n=1 Tax=Corynebacterium sp. Marseille-Q4381 TaxID=3121597 RepID=UPI002FE5BEDB